MITPDQIIAHAVGDYILQSDWMANNKTRSSVAAALHVATYMLPFLLITLSLPALFLIGVTHFVIDRWRLARYVVWLKNQMAPHREPLTATGYPADTPLWMAVWLLIICDNILHVLINAVAIGVFA